MKTNIPLLLIVAILFSCSQENKSNAENSKSNDAAFTAYKERLVLRFWEMYPTWASSVGYHHYDSVIFVPDAAQREKELRFNESELDSLKQFDAAKLDDNNRTDYYLIDNQLKSGIWSLKEMKSYEWDPSGYNLGSTFGDMLNNTYDSLDNRLRNF